MSEDGKSAISKVKKHSLQDVSNRYRSTERAVSRGRNGVVQRNAIAQNSYTQNAPAHLNSQDDLQSHVSRSSFVRDMYQKNYQSLTPAKLTQHLKSVTSPRSGLAGAKPLTDFKTLDAAMQAENVDAQSTVESYKGRSKSYFRNPLSPPAEALVPVPDAAKPAMYR